MDWLKLPDLFLAAVAEKLSWTSLKIYRLVDRKSYICSRLIFFRDLQAHLMLQGINPLMLAIKFSWQPFLDWCLQHGCQLLNEDLLGAINSGSSLAMIRDISQKIGATKTSTLRVKEPAQLGLRRKNLLSLCLSQAIAKDHRPALSWLLNRKAKVEGKTITQAILAGHLPVLKRICVRKKAGPKHILMAARAQNWAIFNYLVPRVSIGYQTLKQLAEIAIEQYCPELFLFVEGRG
jgi:hypothetical protein